jgi:hypothetical protein
LHSRAKSNLNGIKRSSSAAALRQPWQATHREPRDRLVDLQEQSS